MCNKTVEELEVEIAELKKVLRRTRDLICDGAKEGFNPLVGDWSGALFCNNGAISEVLD